MAQVAKLEREREREEARAKEVREGREAGDTKLDELCHWYVLSAESHCFLAETILQAFILPVNVSKPPRDPLSQSDFGSRALPGIR